MIINPAILEDTRRRDKSEVNFCKIIINVLKRYFPKTKIYLKERETKYTNSSIIIEKPKKFFWENKVFFEIIVEDQWNLFGFGDLLTKRNLTGVKYIKKNWGGSYNCCQFGFAFYNYDPDREPNIGMSTRINDLYLNFYKVREIIYSVSKFLKEA